MQIKNNEDYMAISIDELGLSTRTFNCLMRAGLNTLYLLVDNYEALPKLRNIGAKSITEIDELLARIDQDGISVISCGETQLTRSDSVTESVEQSVSLPEDILSRPASDLHISIRILHSFQNEGIETIAQALVLTPEAIRHMRNMGTLSAQQLQEQLELLKEMGEAYFAANAAADDDSAVPAYDKREMDVETAKLLQENYGLKTAWLCDWYGLSRQAIYNKLAKRFNKGNWRNKELLLEERQVITGMINEKQFFVDQAGVRYYLLNNMEDNCAYLIVSEEDIKCFFLADLPEALQARVKMQKLHRFSEAECAALDTLGKTVYILKKQHFMPNDSNVYRNLANARGLSTDEYSMFLFGLPFCAANVSVTDDRIIAFLEENTINGQTYIPSTPDNQWIRSYISRSPYNTEEFIAFYGFSTTGNEENVVLDFTAEDFNVVEPDMQAHGIGSDFIEKLFSDTPLLGSRILSEKNLDVLYQNSRKYVGQLLSNSSLKPSLKAEMQIALAVINYAKGWDTEDESGFWRYITAQFGYRDESGQLRNLLCNCVKDALVRNNRWFVINSSGNQFKSSIVAHAFSTKRSWLYFCDFLFDFYKTNLDWEYIEDDPMIARMVLSLRNKMNASDENSDEDIEISSKVYYFREGIIKLIVHRPKYATQLVSSLIKRIDGLVNHTTLAAATYEEQLCDEWMANKLQGIAAVRKKEAAGEKRTIAIDYTRIRPMYQLYNETEIRIVFPDVRLAQNEFSSLRLTVCHDGNVIEQRALSFYGNELGKTMSGFTLNLEDYLRRSGSVEFDPQIIITCDENEIYNSEKVLYRDCLTFKGKAEVDAGSCEIGGYSLFVPKKAVAEINGAEVSTIKESTYIKGYYADLKKDFVININGDIVSFDNAQSSGELRIMVPNSGYQAEYVENGMRFSVVSGKEVIHIISSDRDKEKKYRLAINSDLVDFESLPYEETAGARIYKLEIGKLGSDDVSLRLMDLSANRLLLRRNLKVIRSLVYRFNRDFYFSDADYREARLRVAIGSNSVREYPITPGDTRISVPYEDGELEIAVPVIKVVDNANTEWNGTNLYWIKDIPQERFVYVKTPAGVNAEMTLSGHSIGTEGQNAFALGNAVYGFSNSENSSWLNVQLAVSANGQEPQKYNLGRIAVKEQFVQNPVLKLDNGRLSWDLGYGFIGDKNGAFKVTICEGTEFEKVFNLQLDNELIADGIELPLGEYRYSISKQSGNLFAMQLTRLVGGSLFVGDVNELRFLKSIIQIDTITFEDDTKYEAVKIRPCYIDQIEYQGIRYEGSEDRECPIYTGVMYFVSDSGKRHEYSYEDTIDEKGHRLYQINPVRIVFINDRTLSITHETGDPDEPGDGFYYYRYFDKYAMVNVHQLTDWEPTRFNRDKYYLADLYSYTRKEV